MPNGFQNDLMFAQNADFSNSASGPAFANGLQTNGQLWIGSTALNAGGTHINVGALTSTGGSIQVSYNSPNINLEVAGGGPIMETLSDDVGTIITPTGNNIQLVGHVNNQTSKFSTVVAGTHLANLNPMSSARWIVDPLGFNGTHTTIAAALTSASSGDTIFLMPGTYTENPTLKAGVNITAWGSDSSLNGTGKVIINGKCTFTTAGTVTISGIQLQTNSDFFLAVTGSVASVVNLNNCYLNCLNNTGISFTTSSASGAININNCYGNLGTTGIGFWSSSSAGTLTAYYGVFNNSGSSTTATTNSAGVVVLRYCKMFCPISCTSTGNMFGEYNYIDCSSLNTIAATLNGTGGQNNFLNSAFTSGTASAISIGASATSFITNCQVTSTNTNAITGAGSLNDAGIYFIGSSSTINTTTRAREAHDLSGNLVLLSSQTASNSASIGFTSLITSTYNNYFFTFQNVVPVSSSMFRTQWSLNNGGAYNAITYTTAGAGQVNTGAWQTTADSTTYVGITNSNWNPATTAGSGISGYGYLYTPASASTKTQTLIVLVSDNASAAGAAVQITTAQDASAETVNAIQFYFGTGNISAGTINLYGIVN